MNTFFSQESSNEKYEMDECTGQSSTVHSNRLALCNKTRHQMFLGVWYQMFLGVGYQLFLGVWYQMFLGVGYQLFLGQHGGPTQLKFFYVMQKNKHLKKKLKFFQ